MQTQTLRGDFAQLGRFLAPIAFTNIAKDVGQQVLNRSVARGTNAVTTLAGFGLAYTLVKLFTNSLGEFKNVGLVLVTDHASRRRSLIILLLCGCVTAVLLALLGATNLGVLFVEDLHGVNAATGQAAYLSFVSMCAFPLLDSIANLHSGCLLRVKCSGFVGMASMADMGLQIVTVTVLLHTSLLCSQPLAIPLIALHAGVVVRLAMVVFGYFYFVHSTLGSGRPDDGVSANSPGYARILRFFWPLALVKAMQSISRPIVNLLCARSSGLSKEAADRTVAVLSLTFPIGHLPYGWLNETRALAPTFRRRRAENGSAAGGASARKMPSRSISLFMLLCLAISIGMMFVLFWIPGVAVAMLKSVNGVSDDLASASVVPLRIFTFFGVAVAVRSHYTGWLMLHERTKAVAPSAPTRVAVIVAMLFILPAVGVRGATMGIAALLTGFLVEALLVVVAAVWVRRKLRRLRLSPRADTASSSDDDGGHEVESFEMDDRRQLVAADGAESN
eukprot:scpid72900/ scgid14849/ Progressive ankylosis protein homolog B